MTNKEEEGSGSIGTDDCTVADEDFSDFNSLA
jgi:hypothetical protein